MSFQQTALDTLKTHNYKITPQRTTVINILAKSKKPLNPYDIAKLSDNTIDVATVYRTMQLFEQLGLIHKIRSVDGYIACNHSCYADNSVIARNECNEGQPAPQNCVGGNPGNNHNHPHCHHYAVCTDCHCVQELTHHHHNHTLPDNFHSDNQVFELTGKCQKCK